MLIFFLLVLFSHWAACLIGQERLVSQYEGEAQLKCVATQSDKEAGKMAAEVSKVTNFTWVEMSSFTECVFPEEKSASSEEKVFPREQSMSSEKLSNESGSVEESAASVTRKRKVRLCISQEYSYILYDTRNYVCCMDDLTLTSCLQGLSELSLTVTSKLTIFTYDLFGCYPMLDVL